MTFRFLLKLRFWEETRAIPKTTLTVELNMGCLLMCSSIVSYHQPVDPEGLNSVGIWLDLDTGW